MTKKHKKPDKCKLCKRVFPRDQIVYGLDPYLLSHNYGEVKTKLCWKCYYDSATAL
jgi:hypothetical protein